MVGLEPVAADHDRDPAPLLGQVHGGLAGRVAAADHDDLAVVAAAGLDGGGRVVDAGALEAVELGQRAAGGSGRPVATITDRAGISLPSVSTSVWKVAPGLQAGDVAGGVDPGAEAAGLGGGPVGQLAAGHAVREARRSSR